MTKFYATRDDALELEIIFPRSEGPDLQLNYELDVIANEAIKHSDDGFYVSMTPHEIDKLLDRHRIAWPHFHTNYLSRSCHRRDVAIQNLIIDPIEYTGITRQEFCGITDPIIDDLRKPGKWVYQNPQDGQWYSRYTHFADLWDAWSKRFVHPVFGLHLYTVTHEWETAPATLERHIESAKRETRLNLPEFAEPIGTADEDDVQELGVVLGAELYEMWDGRILSDYPPVPPLEDVKAYLEAAYECAIELKRFGA